MKTLTQQFVDIEMTDDEVMEAIASIGNQAKTRIAEYVAHKSMEQR